MHAGKTWLLCPPRRTDWSPVVSGMGRARDMVMRRLEQQKGASRPRLRASNAGGGTRECQKAGGSERVEMEGVSKGD